MDDWKSHPWILRRQRRAVKGIDLNELPDAIHNVDEFRDFFMTPYEDSKNTDESNPHIHSLFESLFQWLSQKPVPEVIIPEILRYIEVTGNLKMMNSLLNSRHPSLLLYVIRKHPEMFQISQEEFVQIANDTSYAEIIYRMSTIPWKQLSQGDKWVSWFSFIVEHVDLFPPFLLDYLFTSPNNTFKELLLLLKKGVVKTPNDIQLMYYTCCPEETRPPKPPTTENSNNSNNQNVNTETMQIEKTEDNASHPFKECPDLFTQLLKIAFHNRQNCKPILLKMLGSPYALDHVSSVVDSLRAKRLDFTIHQCYQAIATNPAISPLYFVENHLKNIPLMRHVVKRSDFYDACSAFMEEIFQIEDDDVLAAFLEAHGNKLKWGQLLLDSIFARIYDGAFMTSLSFAKITNLPLDAVDTVVDINELAKLTASRREDLPINLRDRLLNIKGLDAPKKAKPQKKRKERLLFDSDSDQQSEEELEQSEEEEDDDIDTNDQEVEVRCGVLRHEDRREILNQFYELKDVRYWEAMAANKNLPQELRKRMLESTAEKAFRYHRVLALRNDLTPEEVDTLLTKRDLDIYHNLCINPHVTLSREQVMVLTTFAQVPPEEQLLWLPCLKQTHRGIDGRKMTLTWTDKEDDELCSMLMSYQSEMRLLLQQLDKQHNLKRIDNEMLITWASDPDFSITMGIINSCELNSYIISLIVENEANQGLMEDKLIALLDKVLDKMTPEIFEKIIKKKKLEASRKILQLIAVGLTGYSLFVLEKGVKASSMIAGRNNENRSVKMTNEALTDPLKYVQLLRHIFEAHKQDADTMKAVVILLRETIFKFNQMYNTNEGHLKTKIDDLLLGICVDFQVTRDAIDDMISISSPTILCHILNFGNLNHETLWSIFLKEMLHNRVGGPVMRCLALRSNLPAGLRFALALMQSKVGALPSPPKKVDPNSNSMDVDAPLAERNELLHLLLSTGNAIPPEIVHYYIECEPEETVSLLHSSELSGLELAYIRDHILPHITEYDNPIREHFETFINAVQSLAGYPVTINEIKFDNLTSKTLVTTISYARGGIELQLLPEFLTKTLGLSVPTQQMKDLLEMLTILFNYESEQRQQQQQREAPRPSKDRLPQDEEPEEEDVPITSLPISSIVKAQEQFPKIVLSCDIRQYLPPYLEKDFLLVSENTDSFITVPERLKPLFGDNFEAQLAHQIDRFLSYYFSAEVLKRPQQFTKNDFIAILKAKHLSLSAVMKYAQTVQIDTTQLFRTVSMLVDAGLGDAISRDLNWCTEQLFDITKVLKKRELEKRKKDTNNANNMDVDDMLDPNSVSIVDINKYFLIPLLDATTVNSLPYSTVFRFSELMIDVCKAKLPVKINHLINIWGRPEETETRTVHELISEVGFIIDMMMMSNNKDFLQQVKTSVETNLLQLRQSHFTYNRVIRVEAPTNEQTSVSDNLEHSCNLELLETKILETLIAFTDVASKELNNIFTKENMKRVGSAITWIHFEASPKPISEIRALELLNLELLNKILKHPDKGLTSQSTLFEITEYIAPFRYLMNISALSYRVGKGNTQMSPGNLLFKLNTYLHLDTLKKSTMKQLLACLEQVDFCVHKVESAWKNSKDPLVSVLNLHLEDLLKLKPPHHFVLLSNELLGECKPQVISEYDKWVNEKKTTIKKLLTQSVVSLLAMPDFEHTEKKKVYEAEPVPGLFLVQHALMLDEDSMPIINDKGELLRDENSEKTRQPVMNIIQVERELPTQKVLDMKLSEGDLMNLVPSFHLSMLYQKIEEFEQQIQEAQNTTFTAVSKPYLDELIGSLTKLLNEGIKINCPSGRPGPPYIYGIQLNKEIYGPKIESLTNRNQNLNSEAETCIKSFVITRRSTLPQEMIRYLLLLEKSSFKEDSKLRRLSEASLCAAVMQADVNYHVLLDDTSIIKYLMDILHRIGDKLFQIERERQRGSILICFPCSAKGLGILCVSSHCREERDQWDRYLHYNPNACAAEEYGELAKEIPPLDLGNGVLYESVFSGANKRNIVLSFTENAIAQKKAQLNKQALDVIKEGNVHDESNLGKNLNLGQINWVLRGEGKFKINHLHIEAAMCNASPLVPLIEVDGKLVLKTSFQEVINQLMATQTTFGKKRAQNTFTY